MAQRGTSFTIKRGSVEKVTGKILNLSTIVDRSMMSRLQAATTIVYNVARARRPKISITEHKARGGRKVGYRVSDPNAKLGVPVKTGALQASIQMETKRSGKKYIGRIWTNSPYAEYMEFGTSKIKPRPFMRPAMNETGDAVRNIMNRPIDNKDL